MKQKQRIFLPVLLLCGMLLVLLAGCSSPQKPGGTDNGTASADGETTESGSGSVETPARTWEDLPRTDYGNREFMILGRDYSVWSSNDLTVSDSPSTKLDSAIFSRNTAVEARHNIKLVSKNMTDKALTTMLEQQYMNGESDYDLYDLPLYLWGQLLLKGYFTDLTRINLLDLGESWWDSNFVSNMTLYDQLYGIVSDATYVDKMATWSVIFNIDMISDYSLDVNLYDLVDNMEWTVERMKELAEQVNVDLGEPGMRLEDGDIYGICGETYNIAVFYQASGTPLVSYADNELVANIVNNKTQALNVFEKIYDLVADSTLTYNADNVDSDSRHAIGRNFFRNQQTLFMVAGVNNIVNYFTSFEHDYGILPIPMVDSAQGRYYCGLSNYGCLVFGIPVNAQDANRSATVLQALACRGEKTVNPTFYNEVLKNGSSRDPDSARMLDVIFANRVYDLGVVYEFGNLLGPAYSEIGLLVKYGQRDQFVNTIIAMENKVKAGIEEVIAFYEKQLELQ